MKFNNSVVDAKLFSELQDLASILSKIPELEFDLQYGHYVQLNNRKISASHFWDHFQKDERLAGYKTDIYLRALGTMYDTSLSDFHTMNERVSESSLPHFMSELFTLLEDLRLEENIRMNRRGTISLFQKRHETYTRYFQTQLETNVIRNFPTDELFCMIYLSITAKNPVHSFPRANERQLETLKQLKPELFQVFEAQSTSQVVELCSKIETILTMNDYKDAINRYFVLPMKYDGVPQYDTLYDELLRTDPLENDVSEDVEDQDEVLNEKFSTWHHENENSDRDQSFLRFELEQGTKSSILGDGARETEEGDQAMASVQGHSAKSETNDYSSIEPLDEKKTEQADAGKYGKENLKATVQSEIPSIPTEQENDDYKNLVHDIQPEVFKLKHTIDKALEHKLNAERGYLLSGRLSKKRLIPLILDSDRRVFYKKLEESKEIDAVFTLLIDCSASMVNKMDETKKAAVLFHEVLKELKIPHSIIGFWEDGFESSDEEQPNYFHHVISFENSLEPKSGPEILQLEAQEDNRDGFSIRIAADELMKHQAEHQMLLVFSDGEPSAYNYQENGIIDTHDAVQASRKRGIDVIGVFLSDEQINEEEANLMKNIYGREHILVQGLGELSGTLASLLRKTLLSTF